jgi:hypothetical protein
MRTLNELYGILYENHRFTNGAYWWSMHEYDNPINRISFIKKLKDINWDETAS